MRKTALTAFLLAICSLFSAAVSAQSYSFIPYSTSDGLPQSQVQCIDQDDNGYLWIGTLGGLSRFNGRSFENYSVNDGLLNNRITAIAFLDGKTWIGHQGGISIMSNGKAVSFPFRAFDANSKVISIVGFKGLTVIATSYGSLYTMDDQRRLRLVRTDPDVFQYNDLFVAGDRLLIATEVGLYETRDLRTFTHNRVFGNRHITGFAFKSKDRLWVSGETGLFETGLALRSADSIPLIEPGYTIKKCLTDNRGQLWLSSKSGIIRIARNGRQLLIDDRNGMPIEAVKCVFEDRDGTIWVGTDGKGLLRFTGEEFRHFREDDGFPSELFLSITKRNDGTYFFGSYDKGLFQRKGDGPMTPVRIPGVNIWSLKSGGDGTIWAATDYGLSAYRPGGITENYFLYEHDKRVTVIERLNRNKLYVGGANGIGVIENGVFRIITSNDAFEVQIGTVRAFASYKGKILCASEKGIYELVGNRLVPYGNFRRSAVSMVVDNSNHLWVGTESGLYLLKGDKFMPYQLARDPASNTVNFLEVIGNRMYIGTNNGLYQLNTLRLVVERRYGVTEGLINLETNINSSYFDGRYLWFGTAEGLVQFDPGAAGEKEEQLPPILNLSSILLNYAPFRYEDYATGMNANGLPSGLRLPYNMNNLTFELDGVLLSDPDGLRYQFWLEGYDETWSKPVTNATVTLSNLPDGKHILHLRAIDAYGKVSNAIEIPVTITPPFWRTWWFFTLIALIVILAVRSFFRWKLRQERERNYKKNLEYKTRLLALEQQSLNASMNRHFIFNSLNSIQYFINTQDKLSANRYLTNFAKLIRKNLDSAVELDNMVTLQQEMERLELYLSLEAMRFKDRFTYHINDNGIDMESIIVPGMLLQPFVENSIIHGILPNEQQKGHIEVTLRLVGDHLEITIDDNGIGIDFSLQQKHMINGDHKSQGMEITAKRIDIIRELSKKDFELEGPFQVTNPDHTIKGTRVLLKIPIENLDS